MAHSADATLCGVEDVQVEPELSRSPPKMTTSKVIYTDHLASHDPGAPQLSFSLDLTKVNRSCNVKLTKVTNDLGAIKISPRSRAALVQIKPVRCDAVSSSTELDSDDAAEVVTPTTPSGKRVASTALATTSDEDSDSSDVGEGGNIEHDYAHRHTGDSCADGGDLTPKNNRVSDVVSPDSGLESLATDSGINSSLSDSLDFSDKEHGDLASDLPSDLNVSWSPVSDHDYENVSSPGNSSTASGPTYARQPGFTQHAHEVIAARPNEVVSRPKVKKKRPNIHSIWPATASEAASKKPEPTPPSRSKPKRDPLPMRLRALPQSFWQQPNVPHHVSPSNTYQVLPPLEREGNLEDVRPITPPNDLPGEGSRGERAPTRTPRVSERKVTAANTDLLFKLFDAVEKHPQKAKQDSFQQLKRGSRPRKVVPCTNKPFVKGEDPYLNDNVTDKFFPQLSMERSRTHGNTTNNQSLQLITLREGDKSVTLPALSVEQNYPQMLSELVMHI